MRFTSAHIRFFCLSNSLHHSLFPSAKPSLSLPLPVVAEHQEYNCAHNRKDQDAAGYSGQNPRNAAIRHVLRRRNDRGHQVAGRIGAPLRAAPIGRLVGHEHIPAAVHRGIYSMQRIPMAEVRLGGAAFSRSRVIKRAVQSECALFPGMQPIQEYQFPIGHGFKRRRLCVRRQDQLLPLPFAGDGAVLPAIELRSRRFNAL